MENLKHSVFYSVISIVYRYWCKLSCLGLAFFRIGVLACLEPLVSSSKSERLSERVSVHTDQFVQSSVRLQDELNNYYAYKQHNRPRITEVVVMCVALNGWTTAAQDRTTRQRTALHNFCGDCKFNFRNRQLLKAVYSLRYEIRRVYITRIFWYVLIVNKFQKTSYTNKRFIISQTHTKLWY